MTRSFSRRTISIIISIMIVFAFMPILGQDAYAAAKKPGTPKITSAQVNANTVSLKWSKAKNAKKYKVFVQTGADGWKYWKSVKKNKANKKKYSDTLKYKLKASGKKYKVYKKKNPYRLIKTTTALKYKYKGKYSTTYRFVVRAVNGKKMGAYSAAKKATTKAKPTPTPQPADPTTATDPTTPSPATVPPATPTAKVTVDGKTITVQWNKTDRAINYEVYYRAEGEEFSSWKVTDKLGIKATDRFEYSTKYYFKVRAINNVGPGSFSSVVSCTTGKDPATLAPGEYSSNPSTAYSQFEAKMLNYYNEELARRGVSISSTNKADDFQKLQAIIQVVHERMGLSEKLASDYSTFPTGRENWYYGNAYNSTNGQYYNGTDYYPDIEFYGSCDIVADIEAYLAEQAGLNTRVLTNNNGHVFLIAQANYVWYNADAWFYMYPGCNGIAYGGTLDPSSFKEAPYDLTLKLSTGTSPVTNGFKLKNVFYGTSDAIDSLGGLTFGNVIGIDPENASYSSSDENIISFDNNAGTYTSHNTGVAYVTITYTNMKPGNYQDQFPTYTTTISVKVIDQ